MRTLSAVGVTLALLFGGATASQAAPAKAPAGHLIRQHQCVRMDQPMTPVTGYLIRDTAGPARLFYKSSGELTAGLLVSRGGTWELRYQCRR